MCCVLSLNGQLLREEAHPAPEPYSFAFSSPNEDGTASSREETGDASGRIVGSYTILGADGQQRRVEYVADENGFRANVVTNEIGTESQNSADVLYQSSAPTAAELSHQWEASGAGRARLAVGQVGGALLSGAAIRGPIRGGAGLVAAPIGPIGGGIAGVQSLRINEGIGGPIQAPLLKATQLPVPIAAGPVGPIEQPLPIAPVSAPGPIAFGGAVGGAGFTRAQSIGHIGTSFIGGGQPFGIRLAPVNYGQFSAVGAGGPLGVNTASFQQLDGVRGLSFGNHPLNTGANGAFLLLANGGVQPQPGLHLSGATNLIAQKAVDLREEDYSRKSK